MSNSLGVAAVSALLRDVLINRFARDPVATLISNVDVSVGSPDRIELSPNAEPNRVNIFLHQVTPNMGYANQGLPLRAAGGRRISTQPLVLDLHYLITFYGAQPFYAEILFGETAQEFHERAVFSKGEITRALNPSVPSANFPTLLSECGLENQLESIKITPQSVSNEELSKLWGAFQANYRLTAAYMVTTVIIDSTQSASVALPVGQTQSQAESLVIPEILDIFLAANRQGAIRLGDRVRVEGRNFKPGSFQLWVGDNDLTANVDTSADTFFEFNLPNALPGLRSGAVPLRVVYQQRIGDPPENRGVTTSNTAAFLLRPRVSALAAVDDTENIDGVDYRFGTLTVAVDPPVSAGQKMVVMLNRTAAPFNAHTITVRDGNGIDAPDTESASLEVPFDMISAGEYLLRVRVDLAESALARDPVSGLYNGPLVNL